MAALDYSRLASLYDALVSERADLEFFLNAAREAGAPVAEFMAGTGRLAVPLSEAGIDITCVDSSPEMLRVLEGKVAAKGLRPVIVCEDVTRVSLGSRFGLVFIAFHSFEELLTEKDQRACLDAARRHLRPEGRFIVTLHDIPTRRATVGPGKGGGRRFVDPISGREIVLTLETVYDGATGIVQGTESFSYGGDPAPFLSIPLRFRLVRASLFRQLAREAGFLVDSVHADFTDTEYREGRSQTAVWTLRPQGPASGAGPRPETRHSDRKTARGQRRRHGP